MKNSCAWKTENKIYKDYQKNTGDFIAVTLCTLFST